MDFLENFLVNIFYYDIIKVKHLLKFINCTIKVR